MVCVSCQASGKRLTENLCDHADPRRDSCTETGGSVCLLCFRAIGHVCIFACTSKRKGGKLKQMQMYTRSGVSSQWVYAVYFFQLGERTICEFTHTPESMCQINT